MIEYTKMDKKSVERFLTEMERRKIPGRILCVTDNDDDMVHITLDYPDCYKKDIIEVICMSVNYDIKK